MNTPPPEILKAALIVVSWAAIWTRNSALNENVSRKQIYDLWEAVHEIPGLLTRWRPGAEEELLMYFRCYNEKWDSPKLRNRYEDEKQRYVNADQP